MENNVDCLIDDLNKNNVFLLPIYQNTILLGLELLKVSSCMRFLDDDGNIGEDLTTQIEYSYSTTGSIPITITSALNFQASGIYEIVIVLL